MYKAVFAILSLVLQSQDFIFGNCALIKSTSNLSRIRNVEKHHGYFTQTHAAELLI